MDENNIYTLSGVKARLHSNATSTYSDNHNKRIGEWILPMDTVAVLKDSIISEYVDDVSKAYARYDIDNIYMANEDNNDIKISQKAIDMCGDNVYELVVGCKCYLNNSRTKIMLKVIEMTIVGIN